MGQIPVFFFLPVSVPVEVRLTMTESIPYLAPPSWTEDNNQISKLQGDETKSKRDHWELLSEKGHYFWQGKGRRYVYSTESSPVKIHPMNKIQPIIYEEAILVSMSFLALYWCCNVCFIT